MSWEVFDDIKTLGNHSWLYSGSYVPECLAGDCLVDSGLESWSCCLHTLYMSRIFGLSHDDRCCCISEIPLITHAIIHLYHLSWFEFFFIWYTMHSNMINRENYIGRKSILSEKCWLHSPFFLCTNNPILHFPSRMSDW